MRKGRKGIIINIGSTSVKVYKIEGEETELLLVDSIDFKENFDPEGGLSNKKKEKLFELIEEIKKKHEDEKIKIIATGLFRKLASEAKRSLIDDFFMRTGLYLNIISQDLENFYLEKALIGKANLDKPVLLLNIGGGSTELKIVYGEEAIEKVNIDIGVGTINKKFPEINSKYSEVEIEDILSLVKEKLPELQNEVDIAIYTGGELRYMELVDYGVADNDLFEDPDHPKKITLEKFSDRNKDVFESLSLNELENKTPDNPEWMHGARACSAIAQAVFEKYNISNIIPSDSDTVDGFARQEFRHITISGSFRKHLDYIVDIRNDLVEKGVDVLSPRFVEPKNPDEEFVIFDGEEDMEPLELERHHLESIEKSDALIVCGPDGYVGNSALIEMGYANALEKRIIFTEEPEEFMLTTLPAEIGLL